MYLLAIYVSSLENCLLRLLAHLVMGSFASLVFILFYFYSSLYIIDINSLLGYDWQRISPICRLFILLLVSFAKQKLLIL